MILWLLKLGDVGGEVVLVRLFKAHAMMVVVVFHV
jgi:hypothetical protein